MMTVAVGAICQTPAKHTLMQAAEPDSADVARYGHTHFWRASAQVAGMNLGLWAFDRFVQRGDFAYISPRTIQANLRHGFYWDNDKLGTNMFLHPYNGSLYYNAGRSNGFNYWQSGLFAIGGSAMWELFMEREYPSTNDIIATPIGGMAIGEVCFRLSDIILDDRTSGASRIGREIVAAAIDPMRGITRLLTGDAWHTRITSGRRFGTPPLAIETGGGVRVITFANNRRRDSRAGIALMLDMTYGERFSLVHDRPYDYFSIRAELSFVGRQPLLSRLNIMGRLLSRELRDNDRTHLSFGLFQHFDYYDSDTLSAGSAKCPYKLGIPACIGGGIIYRRQPHPYIDINAFGHINSILLGGILSDYYQVDERNYNIAMGFSLKGGVNFSYRRDRLTLGVSHEFYRMYTFRGYRDGTDLTRLRGTLGYRTLNAMGDKSTASFGVTHLRLQGHVWHRLTAAYLLSHYYRTTHYHDPALRNVRSHTLDQALLLTWQF